MPGGFLQRPLARSRAAVAGEAEIPPWSSGVGSKSPHPKGHRDSCCWISAVRLRTPFPQEAIVAEQHLSMAHGQPQLSRGGDKS